MGQGKKDAIAANIKLISTGEVKDVARALNSFYIMYKKEVRRVKDCRSVPSTTVHLKGVCFVSQAFVNSGAFDTGLLKRRKILLVLLV